MAKKYQKAKGGASSLTVKIVAIVLMLVMICAIVFSVLQFCMPAGRGIKPSEWFGGAATNQPKDPDEDENREDLIADENGGLAISQDKKPNGAARLSATRIAEEDYEENGVSPQAEMAVTISIIDIEPANATELLADWSTKFLTDSNEEFTAWAEGKEVSDYVTVTPAEDTLSAVVECTAPFGAQIEVQAQFRTGDKVTISCVCDYYKDYKTADCFELTLKVPNSDNILEEINEISVNDGKQYTIGVKVISVGTKNPYGIQQFMVHYTPLYMEFASDTKAVMGGVVAPGTENSYEQVRISDTKVFSASSFNGLLTKGVNIDSLRLYCNNADSFGTTSINKPLDEIKHIRLFANQIDALCNPSIMGTSMKTFSVGEISKSVRLNFDYVIDVSNANFDKTQIDFNKVA